MRPTRPTRPARRPAAGAGVALLAASALLLAACGDDGDGDTATGTAGGPAAEIRVTDAWARTSPSMADAGAVYMRVANEGDADDALVGVEVDGAVAGHAELHETVAAEGGTDDGAGDDHGTDGGGGMGMMEMRAVDRIPVPAGGSVDLEPGGYHVMLLELAAPLETGSSIELTLELEESGERAVTADVRDQAP